LSVLAACARPPTFAMLGADLDAVGGDELGFFTPMKPNTQRR
jgi:hypothetical protein